MIAWNQYSKEIPQEQPDSQAGDEQITYGFDMGAPDGDKTALSIKRGDTVYSFVGDEAEVILAYAERLATKARLDEQQNLGFDKRFDDPILYCGGDSAISQEERIAELKATLTKGVDHDR